jgi:hypothetical protein
MITLNEFIEKYQNKNIDFDKKYGSQCVDLIQAYKVEVL